MQPTHFVIVGLDGLRADMVTPALTPHLWRLAHRGVWFQHHHAAFPTATRVNVTSLVTGTNSGTHGVVNNSIFEPGVSPDRPVEFGKYEMVEAADAFYGGKLLGSPCLGGNLRAPRGNLGGGGARAPSPNRHPHHKRQNPLGVGFSPPGTSAPTPTPS